MSLILAIESGTEICSVAIVKESAKGGVKESAKESVKESVKGDVKESAKGSIEVLALRESSAGRDHARLIAAFADEMLSELGIPSSQLDAVAVSKGPGSYTGLRVGVSFAKGLCYALRIPLIGVESLEALCRGAMAQQAVDNDTILMPMIDARRMEVYTQPFDNEGRAIGEVAPMVIDHESLAQWREVGRRVVIFGDGAEKCREVLPWCEFAQVAPSAVWVAQVAQERLQQGLSEDIAYFEPFYLKEAVVTKSKKRYF